MALSTEERFCSGGCCSAASACVVSCWHSTSASRGGGGRTGDWVLQEVSGAVFGATCRGAGVISGGGGGLSECPFFFDLLRKEPRAVFGS